MFHGLGMGCGGVAFGDALEAFVAFAVDVVLGVVEGVAELGE